VVKRGLVDPEPLSLLRGHGGQSETVESLPLQRLSVTSCVEVPCVELMLKMRGYPNRVKTFRVICSICRSRPASPCAQSVDPDVTTVAPAPFV